MDEVNFVGRGTIMPYVQIYIYNGGIGKKVYRLDHGVELKLVCKGCCDFTHMIGYD